MLLRDLSELFLTQKSSKQNGNTFYYCLNAALSFIILTLLGTSFLCLAFLKGLRYEKYGDVQKKKYNTLKPMP